MRAEPPVCVGLYARWGAGKTFMISLLKEEFDKKVREDPQTRQLLQFFEEGYEDLEPKNEPASGPEPVSTFILSLLRVMLCSFIPAIRGMNHFVPYGVTTFGSIVCDTLYVCWPKALAKITDSSLCGGKGLVNDFYQCLSQDDGEEQEVIEKQFIFVHFNAWECAACLSSVLCRHRVPRREHYLDLPLVVAQICPV